MRGRLDPFARVGEAGIGADGADDAFSCWTGAFGLFDDQSEGEAKIAAAPRKKIERMGVAVDGEAFGQFEFSADFGDGVPVEEGFFDGLALRVLADAAAALVMGNIHGRAASGERLVSRGP